MLRGDDIRLGPVTFRMLRTSIAEAALDALAE
jgi:hypothetical protein